MKSFILQDGKISTLSCRSHYRTQHIHQLCTHHEMRASEGFSSLTIRELLWTRCSSVELKHSSPCPFQHHVLQPFVVLGFLSWLKGTYLTTNNPLSYLSIILVIGDIFFLERRLKIFNMKRPAHFRIKSQAPVRLFRAYESSDNLRWLQSALPSPCWYYGLNVKVRCSYYEQTFVRGNSGKSFSAILHPAPYSHVTTSVGLVPQNVCLPLPGSHHASWL